MGGMRTRAAALGCAIAAGLLIAVTASRGDGEGEDKPTREEGLAAFEVVYGVLSHPRCANCHPAGDRPRQTDAGRIHAMGVRRGEEGRGTPGLRCSGCHATTNSPFPNGPPGAPDWHLAPSRQAFFGKTARELALQLKDRDASGRTLEQIKDHMADDRLVGWGWKPGGTRTPIPIPREKVTKAFQTWIDAGAPVPAEPDDD